MFNHQFSVSKTAIAICCFVALTLVNYTQANAQAGITVSPSRLYFQPGAKQEQKLILTNPNTERDLEIGVSLNDWKYDSLGNNVTFEAGTLPTSCARNIQILPGSYFTLPAGSSKEITVVIPPNATQDSAVPVRTAMLYFTQLNPGDSKTENGAAIKVTVRMGVKIYQSSSANAAKNMEIMDFAAQKVNGKIALLKLNVHNTGNIWLEGKLSYELFNKKTGKKTKLNTEDFYSLPGDERVFTTTLPDAMETGAYTATAIVNYGKDEGLKLAELDLDL